MEGRGEQGSKVARGISASLGTRCTLCGAWRGAYGLEPAIELYVQHTIEILREIRRVLRKDGVCFWNVGDSYANDAKWGGCTGGKHAKALHGDDGIGRGKRNSGLKGKDLCLMPFRVALAAQADGWWVRSDIIWHKPNPMPESVTDRPTDAYEHILMLTKSQKYFWDAAAAAEPTTGNAHHPGYGDGGEKARARNEEGSYRNWRETTRERFSTRNLRNVWTFATQPYKGAHFATFPEELPRRCILAASKIGDTVLDPFGGSGTTGKVAVELQRNAVLCDVAYGAGGYRELAEQRIAQAGTRKSVPVRKVAEGQLFFEAA